MIRYDEYNDYYTYDEKLILDMIYFGYTGIINRDNFNTIENARNDMEKRKFSHQR